MVSGLQHFGVVSPGGPRPVFPGWVRRGAAPVQAGPICARGAAPQREKIAMSVIEHDFGAGKRKATQRFRKLLSLDALHEANIQANPRPYLERASERIFQLENAVFEAVQATKPGFGEAPDGETLTVDAAEYRRLLACVAILEKMLAEIEADPDSE